MPNLEKQKRMVEKLKRLAPKSQDEKKKLAAKKAMEAVFGKEKPSKRVTPLTKKQLSSFFRKNS
jgi:hypothetical protein